VSSQHVAAQPEGVEGDGAPAPIAVPPPSPSAFRRTFASFSNRDFRYLTLSSIAVGFGQWGQQIALSWLMFVLTGSAAQLGAVAFAGGILSLLLTPVGGILADRYSRRMIMLLATFAGALQSIAIAVLVITGVVQVWHVYVFAIASALTMAINNPARQAYVFDISSEETLGNAVAMNSVAQNVSRIAGPPLAGVLAAISISAPFLFVAVMRIVASGATALMGEGSGLRVRSGRKPLADLAEGFAYLFRERQLLGLMVLNFLPALLVYPYVSFMPIFASRVLHAGSFGYGLLVATIGLGSVVGLFLLAYLGDVRRRGLFMLIGFTGYMGLVTAFTQSHVLVLSLLALTSAGVFFGFATALNTTVFLLLVREDMRGRGMAAWQMAGGVSPLGALPMGLAITRFGPQIGAGVFTGTCFVLFVLITLFWRTVREI
jgi:MFS family permease